MAKPLAKRRIKRAPFILLTVFLLVFLAGVISGEPVTVLQKAKKICLSCIGIG